MSMSGNAERDLHFHCDRDIERLGQENDALKAESPRADGAQRMTTAQRNTLWALCGRYNVAFREDDYRVIPLDAGFTPGFVEGWVGGNDHTARPTIYVGVDPEGQAHS